jgi:hypothetical protein
MKTQLATFAFIVATTACAEQATAEPKPHTPETLAHTASVNLGAVSAMLSKNQRDIDAMIAERTDAIVARERSAVTAQNQVRRELSVYKNTRSGALADSLQAMIDAGNSAVADPIGVAAMEAKLRADIKAGAKLPVLSTEKLDAAAKKLAVLADEVTPAERAKEGFSFLRDTKKAVEKLEKEAKEAKDKADAAPNIATGKAADTQPATAANPAP